MGTIPLVSFNKSCIESGIEEYTDIHNNMYWEKHLSLS